MTAWFQRALVIGGSGAGKSTFSLRLAALTGLPLVHLDREYWLPGWVEPHQSAWRVRVRELAHQEHWIMDGNYTASLDLRLPRADLVLWFDYPRHVCMYRVLLRTSRHRGRTRPDVAPGCPERFDMGFLNFVWRFNDRYRPRIARALEEFAPHVKTVIFRRDADMERFLAALPQQPQGQGSHAVI